MRFKEFLEEERASKALNKGYVKRPKYASFNVGDSVKISGGDFEGSKGKITKAVRGGVNYRVQHSNGSAWLHHAKHLSLDEEAPVNAVGGGAIAGSGGAGGEPGVPVNNKYKKKKGIARR